MVLHSHNMFYWAITFAISFEAIMWGYTLNRHGKWQAKHPGMDKRSSVSARMLQAVGIMSASFSLGMWFLFMYTLISRLQYAEHANFWIFVRVCILLGMQLTHIHFSAVVARYTCLPRSMWPILSKYVSIALGKTFGIKPPVLTSFEVHQCYKKKCEACNGAEKP